MSGPSYGGQAVIEGVMMRGQRHMAIAVRAPSGELLVHTEPLRAAVYTSRWSKQPFVRGLAMLWDSTVLGVRSLIFSAKVAAAEEETETNSSVIVGTVLLATAAAIAIFFVVPVLIMGAADSHIASSLLSNVLEKVIRLSFIVGYIGLIGFLPDIRRVFAYHGAEHKAINAYEDGAPLDVDSVSQYTTAHPRCGTSFLLLVVVVSFLLFALLGRPPLPFRILSRIVLIPVVAGVAYELIKLGASHPHHFLVRLLLLPGMALQRMTTREPNAAQVETAIAALKGVLAADQVSLGSAPTYQGPDGLGRLRRPPYQCKGSGS